MEIFALYVVFALGDPPARMGFYKTRETCQIAAGAYRQAECRPINGDMPIYGTCWACMHGCSAELNIQYCGIDPRPSR